MTKGKFRKETSAAQQKRKTILQTYLTSLVSLVLCVTMFFGTTAAWFTDTVETNQNQMYVGTLDVKLEHASYKNGQLQLTAEGKMWNLDPIENPDYKILDGETQWEPGYTAVEKFRLTEEGTLAFGYSMTMAYNFSEDAETKAKEDAFTQAVTVWTYTGNNAANYELPETYEKMIAEGWTEVGTLYDVLTKTLSLFSGEMDSAEVNKKKTVDNVEQDDPAVAEHIIALHLDEDFTGEIVVGEENKTVQGLKMEDITIKLVATQMSSENDAFGPTYDLGATYTEVIYASSEEELREALTNAENGSVVVLTNDVQLDSDNTITVASGKDVTIDLNGKGLSGTCNASQGHLIMVNNGAILNVQDSSTNQSGKITYAKGTSDTGWAIDLEGKLNLYSGTIELTGESWSIGYCVDVRPNAWGTNYTEDTVFHMYGGKVVSSDGAIRVASSSSDSYGNIVASFIMDGGEISAEWDGIFVQQSNEAYDTLNVTINNGLVTSKLSPVRVYGPVATSVNAGNEVKPMTIAINGGILSVNGTPDESKTWHTEGVIMYGGGMTLEALEQYATITIK